MSPEIIFQPGMDKCNNNCAYCFQMTGSIKQELVREKSNQDTQKLTPQEWERLIVSRSEAFAPYLIKWISGTEPTYNLNREWLVGFVGLLKRTFKEPGAVIGLHTNARIIGREKGYARDLAENGLYMVQTTVNSTLPGIHGASQGFLHNREKVYNETAKGIDELKANGVKTIVNIMLTAENMAQDGGVAASVMGVYERFNPDLIGITQVYPFGRGQNYMEKNKAALSPEARKKAVDEILKLEIPRERLDLSAAIVETEGECLTINPWGEVLVTDITNEVAN